MNVHQGFILGGSQSLGSLNMSARIYGLPNFDWVSVLISSPSPSSQRTLKMITAPDWFRPNSISSPFRTTQPMGLFQTRLLGMPFGRWFGVPCAVLQRPNHAQSLSHSTVPHFSSQTMQRVVHAPGENWHGITCISFTTDSLYIYILYDSCITLYPLVN